MDAAPLVRLRWRLRGAWLWPSFAVLTIVDAVVVHELPLSGDVGLSLVGAWLFSSVLTLLGIAFLSGLVGRLVRRARPDMPRIVARNYAGAIVTLAVSGALLAGGLVHHATVTADRAALREAVARAVDYIGVHAPPTYQENLRMLVTFEVQSRTIYRSCVPDRAGTRQYCVIVNLGRPFGRGVSYSGAEPNSVLSQGTS
ncbi:MAG TPA: hypothetical protein VFN36_00400 [Solirubrobacteraceae bacterium]|nr:hypothetical protein [Solirubrobacteraceae bacterium]